MVTFGNKEVRVLLVDNFEGPNEGPRTDISLITP